VVCHNVNRLSAAGFKEAFFRIQTGEEFTVFVNFKQGRLRTVIGVVIIGVFFANHRVRADLDFIAFANFLLLVLIESRAGQPINDQKPRQNGLRSRRNGACCGGTAGRCRQINSSGVCFSRRCRRRMNSEVTVRDERVCSGKNAIIAYIWPMSVQKPDAILEEQYAHSNFNQ